MPVVDQGIQLDRYMIIPRVLVFITRGEEVLLIRGAADKRIWPGKYNGIGGHIERGEDPLTAARRELFEETGLTVDRLYLRGVVTIDTGRDVGIGLYIFQGKDPGGELVESKEGSLEWIPLNSMEGLPVVDDLPMLLPAVINPQLNMEVFSARYFYDEVGKLTVQFSG